MCARLRVVLLSVHEIHPRHELVEFIEEPGDLRELLTVKECEIHCASVSFSVTGTMKASIDGGSDVAKLRS